MMNEEEKWALSVEKRLSRVETYQKITLVGLAVVLVVQFHLPNIVYGLVIP